MSITLKQIEAFLAVARTLSFTEAAALVHLSQPALSATVQRLEEEIGARLFDRDTRAVALSAVGREFVDVANGLMTHMEHGVTRMRDIIAGKQGHLNIAAAPSVAAGVLPSMLARYRATHPHIEVHIHDVLSNVCAEMVLSGSADIALMPKRDSEPDLMQEVLFQDPLIVLCAAEHPLAQKEAVQWDDIFPHQLVVRGHESSVRQLLEAQYLRHGVAMHPAFQVNHVGTALGLIAAGLGIGVVPASLVKTVNMQGMATCRFDSDSATYWTICVTLPKFRSSPPTAQAFLRLCLEQSRSCPG